MAKIIKITPECMEELRREFEVALSNVKLSDGKLNYTKSFGNIKRDATVFFTKLAWQKMQALIKDFSKEVAWHGLAYRGEEGKDEYFITDILVYPQEVTGAEVKTDQAEYETWLMTQEDDVFNNIRMQGHSHVNMATNPSSVDNSLYERLLEQLDDTMFYIFLIYNKKGDKTVKIYDLAKNILFETSDVTVKVLDDESDAVNINVDGLSDEENKALTGFLAEYRAKKEMDAFVKDAKSRVKDKVYQYSSPYGNGYGSYYGYNVYNGDYYSNYTPATAAASSPKSDEKKDEPKGSVIQLPTSGSRVPLPASKKSGKRKGKRKGKRNKSSSAFDRFASGDDLDDDNFGGDFDDGPYSPFGYSKDGFQY